MKKIIFTILFALVAFMASAQAEEAGETVQLMFVQNAHSVEFSDGKLTLKGVSPTTIYFADRPKREVGHMSTTHFLEEWNKGKDSFAEDPPNAALSIFHKDTITDVIVVLRNPRLKGHDLTYDVRVLDGEMPATGSESSLFIDPLGRPASPTSVAGVHRRERRRHRRHAVHRW